MEKLTRRTVMTRAAASAAAVGACAFCPLAEAFAAAAAKPIDVGPLEDFSRDGVYDAWARDKGFFVIRRKGRLYAASSTCTHKRVRLVIASGVFKCPRHGSVFSIEGEVTKAPARKSLPRFAVRVDEHGNLIVDPSRQFTRKQWQEPGAFVSAPD